MSITSGLAAIAELGDLAGIDVLNPSPADWHILKTDNSIAITPDTVPRFEFRGDRRIADYPLEQGAFASFNKVQEPYSLRMTMVCAGLTLPNLAQAARNMAGLNIGQNLMQKPAFLDTLNHMLASTDLFQIVTPDAIYKNANLEHYDYRRETTNGATMLIVEAWFREVRVTGTASYTQSDSPSAADPVSNGAAKLYAYGSNPAVALQGVL